MREIESVRSYNKGRNYNKRRKRKNRKDSSGCGGCFARFVVFVIIFSALGYGGYKLFQGAGMRSRILQSQYPIKYSDLVEKYAAEYKLDKSLVYAVIRTESKFDQYAVSVTNARGLMQVQSETGGDCAAELKIKDYSSDMLFEPDINIRIGCYYLSKLMKLYNNDVKKSVAAYNAGLGNVDKWLKNSEYADGKGGLKDIPFPETKNYVDGVVKAQKIYKELYFTAE